MQLPPLFDRSPPSPNLPENGYMRLPEVLRVIPVSKSTWWLGISKGKYPKGVKLSERITAWHVDDIKRCIAHIRQQQEQK
jgi:predicted DNA-binding transcriptional regulator AlpA